MKVNHAARLRVPTLWQLLSQAGRSVISLNVPASYPPPSVRGIVVSGMDAPHLDAALSAVSEFAARLKAEVPHYTLRYFWKRVPPTIEEFTENARLTAESFRGRAEGGLLADRCVPDWTTLMVQFQNLDPFQHRAWRYLNVDETGIEDPAWNDAAATVIRGLDEAIGLLCELAERRGAGVLVVSDHGFGPCLGRIHVNRILIQAGIARMSRSTGRLWQRMRQAVDHLRLWGVKRDDPNARAASFDTSVLAQYPFDWKRTLAFAPHQDTAAMIYMNSNQRRPGAPLTNPRQVDEARAAVTEALSAARHPETGRSLFPQAIDTAAAYDLDPAREGYPDLIALPDEPYWVRTKLVPGETLVEPDPNLPGTHRPEGILALSGAGLPPGRTLHANLPDVAPTVLKLLELPIPSHMEGRPLSSLGDLPTTRQDPPARAVTGPHRPQFEYTPEEQAVIEQRLADLGYLE
jgi:predicted AlkP superfamily phosphohydrolase/phosphomutase